MLNTIQQLDVYIYNIKDLVKTREKRIKKLEIALALTKSMICCGESFTKKSRNMVEQALKGGD